MTFQSLDPDIVRQKLKEFLEKRGLKAGSFVERYHISNETSLRDFLMGKQSSFGTRFERYVLLKHIGIPQEDLVAEFGRGFATEIFGSRFEPFWTLCEHYPGEIDDLEFGLAAVEFHARYPRTAATVLDRLRELEVLLETDGWVELDFSITDWEAWLKYLCKQCRQISRGLGTKKERIGWHAKERVSKPTRDFLFAKFIEFREVIEEKMREDAADGVPHQEKTHTINGALFAEFDNLGS